MKILYSYLWGKGQEGLSRKEHEGPRGFLSPQNQVLQKKTPGRAAQTQAAYLQGSEEARPPPPRRPAARLQ